MKKNGSNAKKNELQISGKKLTARGAAAAVVFGAVFLSRLLTYLSWGGLRYAAGELFLALVPCAAGVATMFVGLSRTAKSKRFRKYLDLIGKREQMAVETLANASGVSRKQVLADLEEMLDQGWFAVGYLDRTRGLLVLSDEGMQEEPAAEEQTHAILSEIRQVNEQIDDPDMSAKIDRIELITGKILDYQQNNAGRDAELRSFLNYYLPTTLKILRSYDRLEDQGIEGENIKAAKARIEGMMDKVVEGFERQLDNLFQSDAMDIASDVDVLEQMLKKDGLSDSDGLTF